MRVLVQWTVPAFICAAGVAAPGFAQANGAPPAANAPAAADPNQVICEKQEVTGSRLATRRVCKTRAEWAELRLRDRQEVEKVQTNRGIRAGN